MFSNYKNQWFGMLLSSALFILMLPFSIGNGQLPVQSWTCFFVWIYMVPLWVTIRHQKIGTIITFGFLFCFFSSLGTWYWVFIALKKYGGISSWISLVTLLAMAFGIATFRFIGFFVSSFFQNERHFVWLATFFFSITEWMMFSIPFGGLPWTTPAHAILPMFHLVQSIDLFGVQGMNVLVFLVNFAIAESILNLRKGKKVNTKIAFAFGLIFGGLWSYGAFQLNRYGTPADKIKLSVALLQGNISQDIKWNYQDRQNIITTYQDLTVLASESNPDLIVWPEASLPKTLAVNTPRISEVPEGIHSPILIGAPTWFHDHQKTKYKNSAFLVGSKGDVLNRYDKIKLVPFGEFMPDFGFLSVSKWVPGIAGDFTPGENRQQISQINGHPFGTFICFEVLFPILAKEWVRQGAEFFVSITNDAWFDEGSGPYQHVQFAAFRAIEFRKPIVRAANTGISTWYDETGRQFGTLNLGEHGFALAEIHPNRIQTVYARFPYAVPALLWLSFLCIMIRRKFYEESR